MPFAGPIYMSVSAATAYVEHSPPGDSLNPWQVYKITAPGGLPLRTNRWYFEISLNANGTKHVGNARLKPGIAGNVMDANLDLLAAEHQTITLGVAFAAKRKEDLIVHLTP